MTRFDFDRMTVGETRSGTACLLSREERTTKKGAPYLVLELGNATGRAESRVWSEQVGDWNEISAGAPVFIEAEVIEGWRGRPPELSIRSVTALPVDHPVAVEINPLSPVPRERLEAEFDQLIGSIERPDAWVLLDVVMRHERNGVPLRELYFQAPAAAKKHHAVVHGLAWHSLEVARMALQLADVEPYANHVDRDLLIVGSLLHDIGKIDEYAYLGEPIAVSPFGRLRSHLSRGTEIVGLAVGQAYALEAGVTSLEDLWAVQHIIESHHAEYGSPTQPRCMEATLVHIADLCSARMRVMLDGIVSSLMDSEAWVQPAGWKREPVWHFASALGAHSAPRGVVNVESAGLANAEIAKPVEPITSPTHNGETNALIPDRPEIPMSQDRWDSPILELSRPMAAWLCWLMARDLADWKPERRTRLNRAEATAAAMYVADHLPEEMRTEIPSLPPLLKVG
jgi:3'-5' exoribonuclease